VTIQKPDLSAIQMAMNQKQFVSGVQVVGTIHLMHGFGMVQLACTVLCKNKVLFYINGLASGK
jgi:hypothetical protein